MILEVNVPKTIRNWAVCQVNLRSAELRIETLAAGHPLCPGHYGVIKGCGKAWFLEHIAKPEIRRLERRCHRYRVLVQTIEEHFSPREYLPAPREMVEMTGKTLHYTRNGREIFETLQYCSGDGEKLFSRIHHEIDALRLLSLGFGRTLRPNRAEKRFFSGIT